jgi:hypothetical protein
MILTRPRHNPTRRRAKDRRGAQKSCVLTVALAQTPVSSAPRRLLPDHKQRRSLAANRRLRCPITLSTTPRHYRLVRTYTFKPHS